MSELGFSPFSEKFGKFCRRFIEEKLKWFQDFMNKFIEAQEKRSTEIILTNEI